MLFPVGVSYVLHHGRALALGVRTVDGIVVRFVKSDEIQAAYRREPNLRAFAQRYLLSFKTAKKVLEANGVGFLEELEMEFLGDKSLNSLSVKHGPKPETLSKWLSEVGVPIKRGNHRRGVDIERLEQVLQETSSVNRAASDAGINWKTAADRLRIKQKK
jgi:hypothetical protein